MFEALAYTVTLTQSGASVVADKPIPAIIRDYKPPTGIYLSLPEKVQLSAVAQQVFVAADGSMSVEGDTVSEPKVVKRMKGKIRLAGPGPLALE